MSNNNSICGLKYIPNFISDQYHDKLLSHIDSVDWCLDLKRRTQHYGYKYNYTKKNIDNSMKLGPIPEWLNYLSVLLISNKIITKLPDQIIINEYQSGQGIANHVDCIPCFRDEIVSLSLGSQCIMNFINTSTKQKYELLLESKSLLVLAGDARYNWSHGIASNKIDCINGVEIPRNRRVSITFRRVIL